MSAAKYSGRGARAASANSARSPAVNGTALRYDLLGSGAATLVLIHEMGAPRQLGKRQRHDGSATAPIARRYPAPHFERSPLRAKMPSRCDLFSLAIWSWRLNLTKRFGGLMALSNVSLSIAAWLGPRGVTPRGGRPNAAN